MQSDSIDLASGKLSSLSGGHAKQPWTAVDVLRPVSSKSRRLFGIELEDGYNNDNIFELPESGAAKHVSRSHDFALALPDPDVPSDEGEEYGLDLAKISPGIPSPALLLPPAAAIPVSSGFRDVAPTSAPLRFAPPPLHLPSTNKRLPPTPTSPTAVVESSRADLDRRRRRSASVSGASVDDASGAPPSSEYDEDEDVGDERVTKRDGSPRAPSARDGLSASPPQSAYDVVLDDLDDEEAPEEDGGEAAESATIHRRRGDENHMTFLADESDEETSAWRRSRGSGVELRAVEPAHVRSGRGGAASDRWRT
jgi:hypothetical protein